MVGLCKERVEIGVKGSIDHTRWELLKTIELVEKKRIDLSRSITHRLSLHEVNRGLEVLFLWVVDLAARGGIRS